MKLASNARMKEALDSISSELRQKLVWSRTRPTVRGSDRYFFRSQIPQNPLRILDLALKDAESKGFSGASFTLTKKSVQLSSEDGSFIIVGDIDPDIDRREAEALACRRVLSQMSRYAP